MHQSKSTHPLSKGIKECTTRLGSGFRLNDDDDNDAVRIDDELDILGGKISSNGSNSSTLIATNSSGVGSSGNFININAETMHGSVFASTDAFSFCDERGSKAFSVSSVNSDCKSRVLLASVIEYGVASEQGNRKTMEDRHYIRSGDLLNPEAHDDSCSAKGSMEIWGSEALSHLDFDDIDESQLALGIPFFAVYDGHGGSQCASFLRKKLGKIVLSHPKIQSEPETALMESILSAEAEYLEKFEDDSSGSTAAIVLIVGTEIVTANVGDTEIVLSRAGKAVLLSEKHNLKQNPGELARVQEAGGRIFLQRIGHPLYNPAVLSLGVSRAIGDAGFKLNSFTKGKPSGVIATPFTKTTKINRQCDNFIVVGCDGLWDVLTYQEVVEFCQGKLNDFKTKGQDDPKVNSQHVSAALVKLALQKGSLDNVTVLFINFELLQELRSYRH